MLETYKRFWLLTFDNEEKDNRLQFWMPFFINLALLFLLIYSLRWIERVNFNIIFLPILILLLFIIGYPIMSSAMRRINDVGKDNLYYKNAARLYRLVVGIICLIFFAKYLMKFELLSMDTGLIATIFFSVVIIIFFIYALLPSNYFHKKDIANLK
ncbi:hypothetical protein [Macrococcus animalis]|uniref:hypothetical protein n=1 Tax=Macrococcus animalis TaxID=3395467 RepID=UPI0039BF46B3